MARLYVSQNQMDTWTSGGKVALQDDLMTVAALARTFRIESAVHIVKLVGGEDTNKLVGKVKTQGEISAAGYEHYESSLVVGEAAYECEEGFVGIPTDAPGTSGSGLLDLGA